MATGESRKVKDLALAPAPGEENSAATGETQFSEVLRPRKRKLGSVDMETEGERGGATETKRPAFPPANPSSLVRHVRGPGWVEVT